MSLIERLRSSATAFRENSIYDSEGDEVRLIVQADECDEAASKIEAQQAEIAALREAGQKAIKTLAASRHLIGKYVPDHYWLPEHDQRIADLKAALNHIQGEGR